MNLYFFSGVISMGDRIGSRRFIRSGIYAIRCVANGKPYIGSSENLSRRLGAHRNQLRRGFHCNRHLQSAFRLYGESSFTIEILEFCELMILADREKHWVSVNDSINRGFNMRQETVTNRGVKYSKEAREKMAITFSRIFSTPEHREKMKNAWTPERRKEFSDHLRSLWNNPEYRALQSRSREKAMTPERRKSIGDIARGRKQTQEHIAKAVKSRMSHPEDFCSSYKIMSPDGRILSGVNVTAFCRINGLTSAAIFRVLKGIAPHHKGWRLPPHVISSSPA